MMVWFHRILNTPNVSDIVVLFGPYLPYGAYDPNKPIGSTVVRHFVHIVIDRIPSPNSIFHISSIVVWGNVPLPRFKCPGTIIDCKDFDGLLLIQQKGHSLQVQPVGTVSVYTVSFTGRLQHLLACCFQRTSLRIHPPHIELHYCYGFALQTCALTSTVIR